MQPTQTALPLRYMTFNLCNIPPMDKDKAYEGLRFSDRLSKIFSVIKETSPDIIGFQEVRDYSGGVVMADLWNGLGPLGYRIKFQEGSPHAFAVYNAIAYKASKVWAETVKSWWNSDTPDQVSCSYGNGWPRAVLAIEFYPIKSLKVERPKQGSNEIVTFERPAPDYSSPALLVVNSHLGLGIGTSDPKEKILSNKTTLEKIKEFVGTKPSFVVSLGDFNSFPDSEFYGEEMQSYRDYGFTDGVTDFPLKNQNGIKVNGTFIGYSPDKFKSPDDTFGNSLSHIWFKAFNTNNSWNVNLNKCFVTTLTGDPQLDSRQISNESELLQDENGHMLRDKYPSDHLPVLLDVEVATIK